MTIHKALTIIVIDDNQHLRSSLAQLLAVLGHTVHAAATGEDGVELVRRRRPDLIICDISLEGELNGYAVARKIRLLKDTAGTFLVALSGNSQQQDRERSAQAGFVRHLAKPAALNDIEALVDTTRLHRMRRRSGGRLAAVAAVLGIDGSRAGIGRQRGNMADQGNDFQAGGSDPAGRGQQAAT